MKNINRKKFLEWLRTLVGADYSSDNFANKNSFFLCVNDNSGMSKELYSIEFVRASDNFLYTILIRGFYKELSEKQHRALENYITSLNLGRSIGVDTDFGVSIV